MPDEGIDASRLRDRWLQGLFALALAWTLFWLGIWLFGEQIDVLNPVPEGNRLHNVFEDYIPPLVVIVLAGAVTTLGVRFWPGFFRVPRQVASSRVLVSLLLAAPIVAIALLIVLVAAGMALEPPPWNSDNPQYIPAVFWVAPLGTIVLTPVATVVAAWWWAIWRGTARHEA
jgi:hypothetical protein